MKTKIKKIQTLSLWNNISGKEQTDLNLSFYQDSKNKKVSVTFRNLVPEIPSTTYGTFSIYKYPAKFIPQVIAYILKKYAKPGMKIFDPFAGYGTTGIVSRIYGNEYELWDLNPLLGHIHKSAITKLPYINIKNLISDLKKSNQEFIPQWSNLKYWFPEEFIPFLAKAWGFVYSIEVEDERKYLILIPLLKTTRYFSHSDEKVHKLYRSKYSIRKINNLLKKNYFKEFYDMLEKEIYILVKKIREYQLMRPKEVNYIVKAGVDTFNERLERNINILITSPPYLQAQEYIRSTKLELFWLGYSENFIRDLAKKEIPYRDVERIKIQSEKYYEFENKIKERHLKLLYQRYFNAILKIFSSLSEKITDYMFIFVGPAKIRNTPIPIDDIIIEHLQNFGWRHEITFIDKIVSRVMFESKKNPASGMEDSRIKTEHLVVLKRK